MTLYIFVAGTCLLPLIFWFPDATKYVLLLVEILWGTSYFLVVNQNYRKKLPIHTRGGMVSYTDSPRQYKISYAVMYFIGIGFLFTSLIITLFS
ncbi:hypothetical protein H8L32_18615 [Undibacterium sp. CY18W]|uniref:Uncharacterized protein n=1 Tax=Undibacterium hunanense TaxID=2762292 RepID=A0ABR6ZUH3_9BURK|nr:hypothetical protein [Undibacterium hunanense]MBC3919507.1 hypothetical protein [Undibacterium hunanense]